MALRDAITIGVDNAFAQLQDLAVSATFKDSTEGDYNFTTQEIEDSTTTSKVIQVVVIKRSRESADVSRENITILLRDADVDDLSLFDKVEIDDKEYTISSYETNSFITTVIASGG